MLKHPMEGDMAPGAYHNFPTAISKMVVNVDLAAAIVKQKPSPWTKHMFKVRSGTSPTAAEYCAQTYQLYFYLLIATLNSCINGYDGILMGSINSYKQYREYFGFDLEKGTSSTGIVFAIYPIGNIVGSFAAGPASDLRGK
jgi:Sugar (and other) transporter